MSILNLKYIYILLAFRCCFLDNVVVDDERWLGVVIFVCSVGRVNVVCFFVWGAHMVQQHHRDTNIEDKDIKERTLR